MARTLPWLQTASKSSTTPNSTGKAKKPTTASILAHTPLPHKITNFSSSPAPHSRYADATAANREPSTSPPPTPPSITYMQASDHGWIMVEDEFLATAQTFTQHLHHAEYQRLKKLAAQSNKRRRDDVAPVDGKVGSGVKREMEVTRKRRKIDEGVDEVVERLGGAKDKDEGKEGAQGVGGDEDSGIEEDELIIGDRNLAGLMFNAGKNREKQRLAAFAESGAGGKGRTKTRAAAGLGRQHGEGEATGSVVGPDQAIDDDEDEEDLDATARVAIKKEPEHCFVEKSLHSAQQGSPRQRQRPPPSRDKIKVELNSPAKTVKVEAVEPLASQASVTPTASQYDAFDDTHMSSKTNSEARQSLAAWRKAREEKRQKAKATSAGTNDVKDVKLEDIPTFMF